MQSKTTFLNNLPACCSVSRGEGGWGATLDSISGPRQENVGQPCRSSLSTQAEMTAGPFARVPLWICVHPTRLHTQNHFSRRLTCNRLPGRTHHFVVRLAVSYRALIWHHRQAYQTDLRHRQSTRTSQMLTAFWLQLPLFNTGRGAEYKSSSASNET